jgi:hypothetical protein
MPRRERIRLGYAKPRPGGPQRIAWFEKELDELIRQCRSAATLYITEPDPLGVRDDVKSIIQRSRITLANARAKPETVYALWNERLLGYIFGTMRFRHNWGAELIAAKRQRDGARTGARTSRMIRTTKAQDRAKRVLLEAMQTQHRLHGRKVSQRSFSLIVALRLNETKPRPKPLYTDLSVRSILQAQHFFK